MLGPALRQPLRSLRLPGATRAVCTHAFPRSESDSLLQVPGIGRRAQEKLASKDVDGVKKLCQLYLEEHARDKQALVRYLADAGIVGRWRDTIAEWVDKQTLVSPGAGLQKPITFCVEGNIGAGKSTYLSMISDISGCNEIQVVQEPVELWQDLDGENLLQQFYGDPSRYAFTFQQYVLLTRINREQQTRPQPHTSGLRLIERSVFCDRMVFVKAVHALEQLSDLELKVYDSWFNPCLQRTPELVPDGFVYLRTNAETCERRMRHRNRCEETGVERSYLEKLLGYHDSWLVDGARALEGQALAPPGGGSLVLGAGHRTLNRLAPAAQGFDTCIAGETVGLTRVGGGGAASLAPVLQREPEIPELPASLAGKVVLLDNEKLRQHSCSVASCLHRVPALHVPCDEDIDVNDRDQMDERAQMMRDFREWVRKYQASNAQLLESVRAELRRSLLLMSHDDAAHLGDVRADRPSGALEAAFAAQQMQQERRAAHLQP